MQHRINVFACLFFFVQFFFLSHFTFLYFFFVQMLSSFICCEVVVCFYGTFLKMSAFPFFPLEAKNNVYGIKFTYTFI